MRSKYSGLAVLVLATGVACGGSSSSSPAKPGGQRTTLRLGYFANVTHATAIAGVESGIFAHALGSDKLALSTFNAGPAAVEALFSDALDATYVGPNPTINAFAKSNGQAVRVISGATSGGASLVVKPSIADAAALLPAQRAARALEGKRLATPQLGGTQDVALRYWLRQNGLRTNAQGGGDVSILPQDNAQTLETFRSGGIDGAWVPESWASRLVIEGGGRVLVDERSLWPGGRFVTTQLVVRTQFLKQHPDTVRRLLQGQVQANELVNKDPAEAQRLVNQGITKITGKGLSEAVMQASWKNLELTNDPIASSLATSAAHATEVGLLDKVDLKGLYDLTLFNQVLAGENLPQVKS